MTITFNDDQNGYTGLSVALIYHAPHKMKKLFCGGVRQLDADFSAGSRAAA
jgi:hypothetical protein